MPEPNEVFHPLIDQPKNSIRFFIENYLLKSHQVFLGSIKEIQKQ